MITSKGEQFRQALQGEKPLQIVGVINAYVALMAQHVGFKALYLSGAGVANMSCGLPDLAVTTLQDVLVDVDRITQTIETPLVVDIDTGWGHSLMITRTIKAMIRAGAAAIHLEDQSYSKRCGHRDDHQLVSQEKMMCRIRAAVDAKTDPKFFIIARTDAFGVEGIDRAIERAVAYEEAGADAIFPEALTDLSDYQRFKKALTIPILANITEFGKTPLFTTGELFESGVEMVLYPLSACRAMNLAALKILKEIRHKGTQKNVLKEMQTREELYEFLNYYQYEKQISGE